MANEQERPIEQLLRRYAEHRRRKAGESIELHSVNRRMLQAEVTRTFQAKTPGPRGFLSVLGVWWPRLAIGGASFAVVGLLLWSFLRSSEPTRSVQQMADLKETPRAATAPSEARNEPAMAPRSEVAPAIAVAAASNVYDKESGNSTFSLAGSKDVSQQLNQIQDSSSTQLAAAQNTLFVARPGESQVAMDQQLRRQSAQLAEPAKLAGATAGAAPPTVLSAFRVEQNGQDLRVIDKDGSVYSGKLVASQAPSASIAARDYQVESLSSLEKSAQPPVSRRVAAPASQPAAPQAFSFRVVGTNLNLKQQVVFTGRLLPLADKGALLFTNAQLGVYGGRLLTPTQQVTPALPDYWISGKAVIDGGPEIPINAEPSR